MLVLNVNGYITINKEDVAWGDWDGSSIKEVDVSNLSDQDIISKLDRAEIFVLMERTLKKQSWDECALDVEVGTVCDY
jgi:hypothetical protein